MQPLIGVIADRSRSKWGRRRPFMISGAVVVAFCLLLLGWTSELVATFVQDIEKVGFFRLLCVFLYTLVFGLTLEIEEKGDDCCRGAIYLWRRLCDQCRFVFLFLYPVSC
jgi:solute carrier family 45 protein 1/2/4